MTKRKALKQATKRAVRLRHTDAKRDSMRAGRRRYRQGLGK